MNLEQALGTFVEEARDLLRHMEDLLLSCERAQPDIEEVNALFRVAHTIKGSAGLFGLDEIVRVAHDFESVLDDLRNGQIALDSHLIGLMLACRDHLSQLVEMTARGEDLDEVSRDQSSLLIEMLGKYRHTEPRGAKAQEETMAGQDAAGPDHWHLSLRFSREVFRMGLDPLAFIRYLTSLGDLLQVEILWHGLSDEDDFDPESCYLGFEVALRSAATKEQIEAVFEFVRDDAAIRIVPPRSRAEEYIALIEALGENKLRLGEILVACGSLTQRELDAALRAQAARQNAGDERRLGELLVGGGVVHEPVVTAALAQQRQAEEKRAADARTLKVPADRLDQLINLVGELVIAGAGTRVRALASGSADLVESASHVLDLVESVRDIALRLRMVPIGEVFARFPRVVREVSLELGKEIDLRISGADTELDKSMVEKIGEPLMHLVRNAVDHGIEPAPERTARGKPARGTLWLNACHESGSIVIEVRDDGGGLDADRILRKAIEKGLVPPNASLAEKDIHHLIMEPGFSTAERVTNLSGRGVGMDAVRSSIEGLRGTLTIASEAGVGTSMRICLPLTLAIIDGFLVQVGRASFVVPLDMVVECIELPAGQGEADYLPLRGQVLPFLRLRRLFEIEGDAPPRQNIVVVSFGGRRVGLLVDHLLGEHQTVIKPLGRVFDKLNGISGSTILGGGEVALILDVPRLMEQATVEERSGLQTMNNNEEQ